MKATLDPAKNLDLYFRKERNGSKVFTFLNAAGSAYDLTGIDFQFKSAFAVALVILNNTITIDFDEDEAINRDSYFWELYNATAGKTWLTGTAYFTSTLSAEAQDTQEITIALNGETINITINESGGTGDVNGGTP
jgi:hypothetical protein